MMDPRRLAGWWRRVKPNLCRRLQQRLGADDYQCSLFCRNSRSHYRAERLTTPPSWCWQHMTAIAHKYLYIIRPIWMQKMLFWFHCRLSQFPGVSEGTKKTKGRNSGLWQTLRCIVYPLPFGVCLRQIWLISRKLLEERDDYLETTICKASKWKQNKKNGWVIWIKGLGSSFLFITFRLLAISTDHDAGAAWAWPSFSVYIVKPAVQHPGGLCCTLFAMNLPRSHYQSHSQASVPS